MANNSTTSLHTHFGFSSFRPGQWDAIEAVAIQKNKRALVIQRTGWMATSSPSAPVPGIGAAIASFLIWRIASVSTFLPYMMCYLPCCFPIEH